MSDIKISYSRTVIKRVISGREFLNIFSAKYCNDFLKDGNNLTSLAIHYLERKQNVIIFLFLLRF